ncbi:MAG: antibiotic biosynthesis monooxygenase [Rubritepida sp.]|nr:antibiotic biosynthesis monooxygenase [Rubritepida sp.]
MPQNILVTITMKLKPEGRERFIAAVPAFVTATRGEPGCLSYDFYMSMTEDHVVTTIERWVDPLAAITHLASPNTRHFVALTGECVDTPPEFTTIPWPG